MKTRKQKPASALREPRDVPVKAPRKPGGGRPARYDEPMSMSIAVRLDEDQAEAVEAWCQARGVSPVMLFREAGLIRAGAAELGIGITEESAEREIRLARPCNLPVKMTRGQHAAVVRYSVANGVPPSALLREAALAVIGRKDLGVAKALKALEAMSRSLRPAGGVVVS